eukprot:m.163754 g.163754  ORF g.163754 m.163754 type:complete len:196 (-) comp14647_c0_seq2:630-1217(-)
MRKSARVWILLVSACGVIICAIGLKLLVLLSEFHGKSGQAQAQQEEFTRLQLSIRECENDVRTISKDTQAMEVSLEKEQAERFNGVENTKESCSTRLATAEGEVKYLETRKNDMYRKVLEKQTLEAQSPSLKNVLRSMTRRTSDLQDSNELRNAVIVELAKITDKGVQELQLLSNEDLAVEAQPHLKFRDNPNFV